MMPREQPLALLAAQSAKGNKRYAVASEAVQKLKSAEWNEGH